MVVLDDGGVQSGLLQEWGDVGPLEGRGKTSRRQGRHYKEGDKWENV